MHRPTRLSLLLIPLTVMALTQALPGRAQQPPSVRFAFADTTLLRDTLGLHFDGLFPTADSLQLPPDTLRALMVRWRLTMPRILHLADSLSVTVDSVGTFLDRQKLNPLAGGGAAQQFSNNFTYTSGYDIQKTSTTWTNGSQYRVFRGPLYLTNALNIELQRINISNSVNLRQNRDATTEAGLTVNKGLSFGARSYQFKVFSADPGATTAQDVENKSEYGLTARAASTGRRISSDLSLRGGYLDDNSAQAVKRGVSGSADGRLRFANPGLLTHDLSGSINGNLSRTRPPNLPLELNTSDLATNVRGNLVVLPNSPVRLNVNYGLRNTRVETPLDVVVRTDTIRTATDTTYLPVHGGAINHIRTNNNSADGTLRFRADNDHYLDLNGSVSRSGSYTGHRSDAGGRATLRWSVLGAALDANYGDTRETTNYPAGYAEEGVSRSADATLARNFGPMFIGRLVTSIGLDRFRYFVRAKGATPPAARDSYRQSLRSELNFTPPSQKLSSRVAGTVSLNRTINIAAATASSNTDTRSYRAEWTWTYHVLRPLTVTQNNQLQADYLQYPFSPSRNSLSLSYVTNTSLSAALPGNLSIDIQHNTSQTPRGTYTVQSDGLEALQLSDDTRNYGLNASVRYAPFSGVSLHVEPRFADTERSGTVAGMQAKTRTDQRLDFGGGVDVNLHVGAKGMLTGRVGRTYFDQRTINYTNGVPAPTPAASQNFWNGNLQLTWTL